MADNTALNSGTGGDVIATDELVTLNGSASSGVKVQRVKVGFGADGDFKDATPDNPLPIGAQRAEDLLVLLSRVVKLLESNAVVDQQQRQRITIDAIPTTVALNTVNSVGSVSTLTTVATVNTVAAQTTVAGMDREMYINQARQAYATGVRAQLQFV